MHFTDGISVGLQLGLPLNKFIYFFAVNLVKTVHEHVSALLQPADNFSKSLFNGPHLSFAQVLHSFKLLLDEVKILYVYLLGSLDQILQVVKVLSHDFAHVVQHAELVAVVVVEHALAAHQLIAFSAEVLDFLVCVPLAVNSQHAVVLRPGLHIGGDGRGCQHVLKTRQGRNVCCFFCGRIQNSSLLVQGVIFEGVVPTRLQVLDDFVVGADQV